MGGKLGPSTGGVGMAYSMDFRVAVARAHDECSSSADVAEQFGCSESWVQRRIGELIRAGPDATGGEVAEAMGKPVHLGTVGHTLERLGLPRKKSRLTP